MVTDRSALPTSRRAPVGGHRRRAIVQSRQVFIVGASSFILAGALWEIIGRLAKNSLILVPLSDVVSTGWQMILSGELELHVGTSLSELIPGFGAACIIGIATGMLMASSRFARLLLGPWVMVLYTVPVIALGPLFILWWGIGIGPKILVIALASVFPVIINTSQGLTEVPPNLVEAVRGFGASRYQLYTRVRFPAALPSVMSGLQIGLRGAIISLVVAELFGSSSGLGWLIQDASQSFATARLFVGILTLLLLGIVGFLLLSLAARILVPWYHRR